MNDTGTVRPRMMRGTRDYAGLAQHRREQVVEVILGVYRRFGYEPLDTPAIETFTTLGISPDDTSKTAFPLSTVGGVERYALRYDHTVPLSRYADMNWNKFSLPWSRYSWGPVWRDERGAGEDRLCQFTQLDIDTVGPQNPALVDAQVVAVNYTVLRELDFKPGQYQIRINDRRLLNAIVESVYLGPYTTAILREWDKLDRQDRQQVRTNLADAGLNSASIATFDRITDSLVEIIGLALPPLETLSLLESSFSDQNIAAAVAQLRRVVVYLQALGVPETVYQIYPLLARGLAYYTGTVFEAVPIGTGSGSIMGGGRYDQLIAKLGGPDWPASGSSIGLERLMFVMREIGILPAEDEDSLPLIDVFIATVGPDTAVIAHSFRVASKLRLTGLRVEVYNGDASIGKQLALANKKSVPLAIIIGENEVAQDLVQLKDMVSGDQHSLSVDRLAETINWRLNV